MSLAPGTQLGSYEIVSLIGAGGMGEVYRARDPKLGRDVAVNPTNTFETATPTPLFKVQVSGYSAPNRYVVARDGQRFLVNCPAQEMQDTDNCHP